MSPSTATLRIQLDPNTVQEMVREELRKRSRFRSIVAGVDAAINDREVCNWLSRHGVKPADTFRLDLIDEEYLVAHRYALNGDGRKFVHRAGPNAGEAALAEPFAVRITEPIPEIIR